MWDDIWAQLEGTVPLIAPWSSYITHHIQWQGEIGRQVKIWDLVKLQWTVAFAFFIIRLCERLQIKLRGFVKLKKNPKIRKKLGSGWVGGSSPSSDYNFVLEMLCFLCCFHVSKCFKVFLWFFDFFLTWQDPLESVNWFQVGLPCQIEIRWVNERTNEQTNKRMN